MKKGCDDGGCDGCGDGGGGGGCVGEWMLRQYKKWAKIHARRR